MAEICPVEQKQEGGCELFYSSSSTFIYRLREVDRDNHSDAKHSARPNVAVKVLNREHPNKEDIARFYNEYEILSDNLCKCNVSRRALKKATVNGTHAMHLQWVNGVTLEDYLKRRLNKTIADKKDIIKKVRLAHMIANALSQIHGAKVVHNDFSSTNILVEPSNDEDSRVTSVKIIDFGSAFPFEENSGNESKRECLTDDDEVRNSSTCARNDKIPVCTENDLISLGIILYKIFVGRNPCIAGKQIKVADSWTKATAEVRRDKKECKLLDIQYNSLIQLGLPVTLCDLISSLMKLRETGDQYYAAVNVEEDLNQMLNDPQRFLVDQLKDELKIPRDQLYGRSTHIATLLNVYKRVFEYGGVTEMVLVSGFSGTGKSSLVQKLRAPMDLNGGVLVSGKFDHQGHSAKPLHAIATAFNAFCNIIIETRSKEILAQLRIAMQDSIGPDSNVLTDLIPNLSKIIMGETKASLLKRGGNEELNRLHYCFRMFFREISRLFSPLILFFDDLQWADKASLDLIQTLVSGIENAPILFIGCFRDNEINHDHPFSSKICNIEKTGITINNIKVGNIGMESVNELISDILCMSRNVTRPLATIVHRKTRGNSFFVIQFLKSLHEDGLLCFSLFTRRWEWTMSAIISKDIANNVAEFMVPKMLSLPKGVQSALKVVACFGFHCDSPFLEILNRLPIMEQMDIFCLLEIAIDEGLVDKTGSNYKFAHDQIHRAAYLLIPINEQEAMHLSIGRLILNNASKLERDDVIFFVANQMNRGRRLLTDHDDKVKLAKVNLLAGEEAIAVSAFLLASTHLKVGISLLVQSDWEENYELCMGLFNSAAETHYAIAEFDIMLNQLKTIFSHARLFNHQIRAHYTFSKSLGTRGKLNEAIHEGFQVLAQLGETFPVVVDEPVILTDFNKTKDMLESFSEDSILSLALMKNETKVAAMEFLNLMVLYTFVRKKNLFILVNFRMIKISLSYGVCRNSAYAFAIYGSILCGPIGDIKGGCRFGKLALKLLERFDDNDCLARVYAPIYTFINPWNEPLQLSFPPLLHAHKIGMLAGDIEYAFVNLNVYLVSSFHSGKSLKVLSKEMEETCHKMMEYGQDLNLSNVQITWQVVLNLMGCSDDPIKLSGNVMDQEELLKEAKSKNNARCELIIYYNSMWLAYYFGRYELAAEMARKSEAISKSSIWTFAVCDHTFCHGLISLALGRRTEEGKWRDIADVAIEKMKNWTDSSAWNFQHKFELLKAELFFLDGHMMKAAKAYDEAIALARDHRFINDQALACERAGIFYNERKHHEKAFVYYTRAQECYIEWGAQAKADHIQEHIIAIQSPSSVD